MDTNRQTTLVLIACNVLQDMLQELSPNGLFSQTVYFDFGLHSKPDSLRQTLQQTIDEIEEPSLVVLGYGLCGNGTKGLKAGQHTLLLPRVHDCIAMILGSRQAFEQEHRAEVGTYYLSRGWLEASDTRTDQPEAFNSQYGADPLTQYELYLTRYNADTAAYVMDKQFEHYTRLALVAHNQSEMEKYRPRALEIAEFCQRFGMRYQEIMGSNDYMRHLIQAAEALEFSDGTQMTDDFLIIPPGGEIRQHQF